MNIEDEISRIETMINSGPMQRMRQQTRSSGTAIRPRNASSIILIKGEAGDEKIVMGKRNKALKFMPGALVFPGGSVDRNDHRIPSADELNHVTAQKLMSNMRGNPLQSRARALGIAAVRELAEETGLLLGKPALKTPKHPDWKLFAEKGLAPSLEPLRLLARAVTPPGLPKRFDTWFFVARLEDEHHVPNQGFVSSGELEDLQWISPEEAMGFETREITRVILVELMKRLRTDPQLSHEIEAPSYETRRDKFQRKMM